MSPYLHFDNRCSSLMQDDVRGIDAVYPNGPTGGNLTILTSSIPNANADVDYSATLEASGGTGAYHWSLQSGQIPNGIQLGMSGLLYGIANGSGSFAFTTRVIDSSGNAALQSFTLFVNPSPFAPVITGVEYRRKKLFLTGRNFQNNARVYVDGEELPATLNGTTLLTQRRKQKPSAHQVYVRNPDGRQSNTFQFVIE
jgi:hypothetical protein